MERYIDADELIKKIFPYDVVDKKRYAINAEAVYKAIQIVTAADVVKVVRCKDCKHRVSLSKMCAHPKAIGWDAIEPEDDDFCSYGERKEK